MPTDEERLAEAQRALENIRAVRKIVEARDPLIDQQAEQLREERRRNNFAGLFWNAVKRKGAR